MPKAPDTQSKGLSVRVILNEAWSLVEEKGVNGLSTRALAARLNVKSPALYWHIKNKDELLSLMLEQILTQSLDFEATDMSWDDWARAMCHAQHDAFLAHRDSGRIATIAMPSTRVQQELLPRMYEPFMRAGLDKQSAVASAAMMITFVLGWVIYEQRGDSSELIKTLVDPDAAFNQGVEMFISGVKNFLE